jgi:hypothetical protein
VRSHRKVNMSEDFSLVVVVLLLLSSMVHSRQHGHTNSPVSGLFQLNSNSAIIFSY